MVHRIHNAVAAGAALSSVALLATAAFLAPGCTVLTDDALPDDAGPESSESPPLEAGPSLACEVCVAEGCAGPWAVCFSDDGCIAEHFCTKITGSACGADADTAVQAKSAAFAACNTQKTCGQCASICGDAGATSCVVDAGDAGDATVEAATDAEAGVDDAGDAGDGGDAEVDGGASVDICATCVNATCGVARAACLTATPCGSFLTCVHACGDTACAEDCGQRFADGKAKATELSNCTLAGCRGACAL